MQGTQVPCTGELDPTPQPLDHHGSPSSAFLLQDKLLNSLM